MDNRTSAPGGPPRAARDARAAAESAAGAVAEAAGEVARSAADAATDAAVEAAQAVGEGLPAPAAAPPPPLAAWRPPPVLLALGVVALAGFVLLLLKLGARVVTPILLAFVIAALAHPPFAWLQARGLPRWLALLCVFLLIVGIAAGAGGLVYLAFVELRSALAAHSGLLVERIGQVSALAPPWADALLDRLTLDDLGLSTQLARLTRGAVEVAANLLFSLALVAFLLAESRRFIRLAETELRHIPFLAQIPDLAVVAVRYFGVRTVINLFTGVSVTLLLWLLGIGAPWLWGALAFVLSYIPYLGLPLALLPPALLALVQFGPWHALLVVGGGLLLDYVGENVIMPYFAAHALKLSPTAVFVGFFFWAWLLGPTGALLAVPLMVLVMLTMRASPRTLWLARLIGQDMPPRRPNT
jgi:predicted PurR-regulated permease PerM